MNSHSKPNDIQTGCRAVLVNSTYPLNNGIVVTIGACLGDLYIGNNYGVSTVYKGIRWEVDKPIRSVTRPPGFEKWKLGGLINHVQEANIRRIDGYDGNEPTSWEALKGLWTPEEVLLKPAK